MSAVRILPHYTYSDYCNWEGRWELIEWIPYAMSPAPSMGSSKYLFGIKSCTKKIKMQTLQSL